jgi:hypothetical protein
MRRTNEPGVVASDATGLTPRALNVVLGAWLSLSAFAWPHARWQFINTLIPGILVVVFALAGCISPRVRYLNTALAAYLLVSALCYPAITLAEIGTQWHNATVALWILLISVLDNEPICTDSSASRRPRSRLSA